MLALLALSLGAIGSPARAADPGDIRILRLPGGLRFGLIGGRPARPAPTLFVLVHELERMRREPAYTEVSRRLLPQGFIGVILDPPACGEDRRPGEATDMSPWRLRLDRGEDFTGAFTEHARAVLDYLIREGYTDPNRVAACGTSKGAYLAFHFAAADRRVRLVAGIAPLTDLMALDEFAGTPKAAEAEKLSLLSLVPDLAGRPVWVWVGNNDRRIDTDRAIAFTRALVRESIRGKKSTAIVPVELSAAPSAGHGTFGEAHARLAAWILAQFGMPP